MDSDNIFKKCPLCAKTWETREAFLADPLLDINGHGVDFDNLEDGLFYFTHKIAACGTTMVLKAKDFLNLYTGKKYSERRTGEEDCPGYCLDKDQLERCQAFCEYAFVREIIHIVKHYPKKNNCTIE